MTAIGGARKASQPMRWDRDRLLLLAAGLVLGIVLAMTLVHIPMFIANGDLGADFRFYQGVGDRWLATGMYYLPRQLTGQEYHMLEMVDTLYPPAALLLFVPIAVLPDPLAIAFWWAIPLGVLGYVVWGWKPAPWAILAISLILLWPRPIGAVLWGNTDIWVAAFVAAGIRWKWPAAFIALKPVFLPLALFGVRSRWFWVTGVALFVISMPMLADYATAMLNIDRGLDYSLGSVPTIVLPLVAWLGRQPNPRVPKS